MKLTHRLLRRIRRHYVLAGVLTVLISTVIGAIACALDVNEGSTLVDYFAPDPAAKPMEREWVKDAGWLWLARGYYLLDALAFVPAYGALLVGMALRLRGVGRFAPFRRTLAALAIVAAFGAMAADEVENILALLALFGAGISRGLLMTMTGAKFALVGLAALVLAILLLLWFYGAGEDDARGDTRATLRAHVTDIVWRNRYNLIGLALLAGLILVMDQSRDVLVGLAQGWDESRMFLTLAVVLVSYVALWALAHTCWIWCRILCRLCRPRVAGDIDPPARRGVFLFVRWSARLLGAAPVLMLMWLCGLAARDAARSNAWTSVWMLLGFGFLALLGAMLFLWGRAKGRKLALNEYFEQVDGGDAAAEELVDERYDFLWLPAAPLTLPIAAMIGLTIVRWVDIVAPKAPSLSFIVICLSMTLWIGAAGYLSQVALRHARPYVAFLLVVIAVLGTFGCTDNHVVWLPPTVEKAGSLLSLWYVHAALTAILIAGAWAAYKWAAGPVPWRGEKFIATDVVARTKHFWRLRIRVMLLVGVATLACALGLLLGADHLLARSRAGVTAEQTARHDRVQAARPPVRTALVDWLNKLCDGGACAGAAPYTVYFVSTEGGGIRAAYWTALVLAELSARVPDFDKRTFSVSGVSGGAVGAAIYRVCRASPEGAKDALTCVHASQEVNLLTPLLSAFMFEDVVARVIPTGWCKTPGCGVMSRGAWFEQAMEVNLPAFNKPFAATRPPDRHLPYLFLNSTWVETGERAIASEVRVDWASFPTARDQLRIAKQDLPTSTAAHNAARFPYINAIGSLKTPLGACPVLERAAAEGDRAALEKVLACGHLADGGYFDNSGGHTTADVLRALGALLRETAPPKGGKDERVPTLDKARLDWLRANVVPQVLMIRNGVEQKEQLDCREDVPEEPRCKGRFKLMTDLLGPAVAAFNTIGIGANGRVAESLLKHEALAVRPSTHAPGKADKPVVTIDLTREGVLFPLGWYLSRSAQCGMERQARLASRYKEVCFAADAACAKNLGKPAHDKPRDVCEEPDKTAESNVTKAVPINPAATAPAK